MLYLLEEFVTKVGGCADVLGEMLQPIGRGKAVGNYDRAEV